MWLARLDPSVQPPSLPDPGIGAGALGQTLLALLLTCALAFALLRLLRPSRPSRSGGSAALSLLAQLPLSQGHVVYLVRAPSRCLLLGGSPAGLALLGEVDEAQVDAALRAAPAEGASGLLARLRSPTRPTESEAARDGADLLTAGARAPLGARGDG